MSALPALEAFADSRPVPFITIVREEPQHVPMREVLLDAVMGTERRRKASERLREGRQPAEGLAFLALDAAGSMVATVRLWPVLAGTRQGRGVPALLLGPLAVDGRMQSLGAGSRLMRHAIEAAAARGHGAILLVGDPGYYARFGFDASVTGALTMPGPFERHRLLGLELRAGHLAGCTGAIVATEERAVDLAA